MGLLIKNINDVANKVFGTDVKNLKHDVYKYTACGAWIDWDDLSVTIGSIVEGSDAEFDRKFEYPFDSDEIDHWIVDLEKLTTEAWREANMNELTIFIRGGSYIYYKTECDECLAAFAEFQNECNSLGINIDNILVEKLRMTNPCEIETHEVDYSRNLCGFEEGFRLY